MEQRQHGLGDVLDDYCPRERRVTNHAVVALVGDEAMAVASPLPIVGTIAPGRDMRPSSSVSLGQQKARPPPSVSV